MITAPARPPPRPSALGRPRCRCAPPREGVGRAGPVCKPSRSVPARVKPAYARKPTQSRVPKFGVRAMTQHGGGWLCGECGQVNPSAQLCRTQAQALSARCTRRVRASARLLRRSAARAPHRRAVAAAAQRAAPPRLPCSGHVDSCTPRSATGTPGAAGSRAPAGGLICWRVAGLKRAASGTGRATTSGQATGRLR